MKQYRLVDEVAVSYRLNSAIVAGHLVLNLFVLFGFALFAALSSL